jgi:hypothetical protein
MKTNIRIISVIALLFVIALITGCKTSFTSYADPGKASKEAKLRWKEYKRQGFVPDPRYGTGPTQFQKIINFDQAIDENANQKFMIGTQNGSGPNQETSFTKARQNARREIAANLGSFYEELISGGTHFNNIYGEDISTELWESTSAFDEIFGTALSKNTLISRFYKMDRGNVTSAVTIAIDIKEFNSQVMSMEKDEIRSKIEEVRKRKDQILKKN